MRLRPISILAALVCGALCALQATAQTRSIDAPLIDRLERCAHMSTDQTRLECYDRLARSAGFRPLEVDFVGAGWKVRAERESEHEVLYVTLQADGELDGKGGSSRPSVVFRCEQGAMTGWIRTGLLAETETEDERKTVLLRFDGKPYIKQRLVPIEDGYALQFGDATSVAHWMIDSSRFSFQFNPLHSWPTSADFTPHGLDAALEPLMDACGLERLGG